LPGRKNPGKHDIENIMNAQTERENETNNIAREKSCECQTCNAVAQAIRTARKPICAAQNCEENDEERLHRVHRRIGTAMVSLETDPGGTGMENRPRTITDRHLKKTLLYIIDY
jgi:hypothetical protein